MNYGLSLCGGGTKGAIHVGVLKALKEEGLLPTSISGTSAGSIVAGLYAGGVPIEELCDLVIFLSKHGRSYLDPYYLRILAWIPQIIFCQSTSLTGFLKGKKFEQLLCEFLGDTTIDQLPIPTVIPAVDLCTGNTIAYTNAQKVSEMEHVIWEKNETLCKIIMASSSVPGIFCPRKLKNYHLVDGGITNNLPVDLLAATGETCIVAVDISPDYQTPHDDCFVEILSHSFSIMNHSLKDCMSQKEQLLLKPPLPKDAGLLTFGNMVQCMENGYQYTKSILPKLHQVLESFNR